LKGDRASKADELIFIGPAGRQLAENALVNMARRIAPGIDPHGFRSTFRDFAGDKTNASDEVAEFCLGHVKKGVAKAYRRTEAIEKRRSLLQLWANYCADAMSDDNVVAVSFTMRG
jgi:hypothetical protein